MRPATAILVGGVTVAALDIADAFIFYGAGYHVGPARLLRGIASGLLGHAAFQGGAATALLGAGLHLFISTTIVAVYVIGTSRWPAVRARPWTMGALYGLIAYSVMYFVVLPRSRAAAPEFSVAPVLDEIFAHVCCVGIPAALFARASRAATPPPPGSPSPPETPDRRAV